MRRDNHASVGIGTMITFIAIILVSALISMTIVITLEKAFKNQSTTADAMEERGKIVVESIMTYLFEPCWQSTMTDPDCNFPYGHHQLLLYFHLAPGSTQISDTNVHYMFRCINEEGGKYEVGNPVRSSDFNHDHAWGSRASVDAGTTNTPIELGRVVLQSDHSVGVDVLEYGPSYLLKLEMYDNQNTATRFDDEGCRISENYDTQLLFIVGGGSPTEFTLHFRSLEVGQLII